MSPQNRILTEILAPARRTAMVDAGTRRNLHVYALKDVISLPVPAPAHLALFDFFPIWGTVKNSIPVTRKRCPASLPARKSN